MIYHVPVGDRAPFSFCIVKGIRGGFSVIARMPGDEIFHSTKIVKVVSRKKWWNVTTHSGSTYRLFRNRENPACVFNPYFFYPNNLSSMEEVCQEL